jgi:hypothetical protein
LTEKEFVLISNKITLRIVGEEVRKWYEISIL